MKRILLVCLIGLSSVMIADDECCNNTEYRGAFFIKQGAFLPQDTALRNMFDTQGTRAAYFVEGAFRYNFCYGLNLEITASWLSRKGRALVCQWPGCCNTPAVTGYNQWLCTDYTTCCGECVKFEMPTVGAGLKYFFEVRRRVEFFLGGAFKLLFVRVENDSPYVARYDKKTHPGGVVNLGLHFNPYKCFFIELTADYLIGKISSSCPPCCSMNCDLNVSGLIAGFSLGCKF